MKRYYLNNGNEYTSKLDIVEFIKRIKRLDILRVLTEGYETGEGKNICEKAWRAYNKKENFTGIIRLTLTEKDFISYMLENECNTFEDIETIRFYLRLGE